MNRPRVTVPDLASLRAAAATELRDDILPFWERYAFDADDFLVAEVSDSLEVSHEGPRNSVLVARVLWTFAESARQEPDVAQAARWLEVMRRVPAQ